MTVEEENERERDEEGLCACGEPLTYVCRHGLCKNCGECIDCEMSDRKWEGI